MIHLKRLRSMTSHRIRRSLRPFVEGAEMFWVGFTVGMMAGGSLGMFTMAACVLAGRADQRAGLK